MARINPILLIVGGVVALELFRPGSTPLRGLLGGGGLRLPAFGRGPAAAETISPWERLGIQAGSTGLTWLGGVVGDWLRSVGAPAPAAPVAPILETWYVDEWGWDTGELAPIDVYSPDAL